MADRIVTYYDQLEDIARSHDIALVDAFDRAGLPNSTFYRIRKGSDMKSSTAVKVAKAIALMGRRRVRHAQAPYLDAPSHG